MAESQQEREKAHALGVKLPRGKRGTRPPPTTTLRRRLGGTGSSSPRAIGRGSWSDPFSSSRLQRSTVKVAYSRNGAKGAWAAHGRYLAREGAQREGERGKGFGADGDDVDIPKELGRWQRAGDPRMFKLIVSPEAGGDLDLREHARAVMRDVERDVGVGLEWIAIDHHNTDNPHVHIVVRGIDREGRELRFEPSYVKTGFRQRSQEQATRKLGLRTERSIASARERAVEKQQFTEIDRAILRRAGEGRVARYDGPIPDSPARRSFRLLELRRLALLSDMGLAERISERSWRLAPNIETTLREFQRSLDVLKTRARHQELISDPQAPLVRTELQPGVRLTGKVVGTGLADEAADRRYVLLEGSDGRVHYVERPPGDGPSLRPGRIVTLAVLEEEIAGIRRARLRIEDHGKLPALAARRRATTVLDREALATIERGEMVAADRGGPSSFASTWRHALRERLPLLERAGLVIAVPQPERSAYELTAAGRRLKEELMQDLERHLPTLEEIASERRKAIVHAEPEKGVRLRGKLVAYATDVDGRDVALVDVGPEILALRTHEMQIREGADVRVRTEEIESENQRRRLLVWRITAERELEQGR